MSSFFEKMEAPSIKIKIKFAQHFYCRPPIPHLIEMELVGRQMHGRTKDS